VRKSKGFSWGPAGLSTALFTGPLMADVLRYAKPLRQAKYVCMEGADKLVSIPPRITMSFSGPLTLQ
jgi:nitrate reductase (NAD(P)H)